MKIVVTCGPSYEPIDRVRRLTNFSTGTLGVTLANYFVQREHEVICLKGEGSTCCEPCRAQTLLTFGTNDDLAAHLQELAGRQNVNAVLHAAALCDFRVEQVSASSGERISSPKIPTRDGRLYLELVATTKVLPRLRPLFPHARLIGWKYELAGTRDEAFAKAWRQIEEAGTDACVLNGAAYGNGFAFCARGGHVQECADTAALCTTLAAFLS